MDETPRPQVLHIRIPHTYPYADLRSILNALESIGFQATFVDNGNITIEKVK